MPNYLVFKKSTSSAGTEIFKSLPPSIKILKKDKAKLKATLRKYLCTQTFYSVDEFFLCEKMMYNTLFVKCLQYFTLEICVSCVFMTFSTSWI